MENGRASSGRNGRDSLGWLSSPILVGRGRERGLLLEAITRPPALILVEGEAGVGKSRLVRETLTDPAVQHRRVLIGHCHRLRAYPGRAAARIAVRVFLKAIRPLASWSSARWFCSFFDQRMRIPRLRFSHECAASTTQRRVRQSGLRSFSSISSPRVRICAVKL